jgi:riboflavin kinase/FMN adenylyltransferase
MRVVGDLAQLERSRPAILTIGGFDGVHRGHQFLIRQVVDRARRLDFDSAVISFTPRPEITFRPDAKQLTDGEAKARLIAALGTDIVAVVPFNREVSKIPAGQFLGQILAHVNLAEIWVGADFAFGHNREGNVDFLIGAGQSNGFGVHVINRQGLEGTPISSTLIRGLVSEGAVDAAAQYLGYFYGFEGVVETGFRRGRELGFPTANVRVPNHQILPASGIYAGFARLDGRRVPAAIFVGYAVQFDGTRLVVEAYLLDFEGDLEGTVLGVEFVERVREERKFESVEALVEEMHRDVAAVRHILAHTSEPREILLEG